MMRVKCGCGRVVEVSRQYFEAHLYEVFEATKWIRAFKCKRCRHEIQEAFEAIEA